MNHEILFWYTGAIVWWIIFAIVSISIVVGAIVGVICGFAGARRWVGIRIVSRAISKEERELINQTIPGVPDSEAKIIYKWLERFYDRMPNVKDQPAGASAPSQAQTNPDARSAASPCWADLPGQEKQS